MNKVHPELTSGFEIVAGTERSQAGVLVLQAGGSTGGPENRHPDSDQWVLVLAGRGDATVEGERVSLTAGDLLLIEAGEAHEIAAAHDEPLRTVSVYAPPAY
jgi:quercetin dioxygenase-like cupin family protein